MFSHPGVHVHRGQVVGDHVVQLPADPQAFLGHLSAGLLLAGVLGRQARSMTMARSPGCVRTASPRATERPHQAAIA